MSASDMQSLRGKKFQGKQIIMAGAFCENIIMLLLTRCVWRGVWGFMLKTAAGRE